MAEHDQSPADDLEPPATIQPAELARWSREAGLSTQQMKGMEYNPITQRYWLSGDTSVNYMVACRRPA